MSRRPCKEWREPLRAWSDGHASLDSREALETHAASCPACAAELRVVRRLRSLLDGAAEAELTRAGEDTFLEGVFARIDGEPSAPVAPPSASERGPARLALVTLVTAAAAALLLWLRAGPSRIGPTSSLTEPPAETRTAVASAPADSTMSRDSRDEPAQSAGPRELVLEDVPRTLDAQSFDRALRGALARSAFDPSAPGQLEELLTELGDLEPAEVKLHVRRLARDPREPGLRAAALRLLGPGADARDRALIDEQLEDAGAPAAWALLDVGERGAAALWRAASGDPDHDRTAAALGVLLTASRHADDDPILLAPRRTDAALVARVAIARPGRTASDLLARFLDRGETPWLDAWAAHPDAAEALRARAERGATRRDAGHRLVQAASRHAAPALLPLVMDGLRADQGDAPAALARLLPYGGARALLGALESGRLSSDIEERAWNAALESDERRLFDAAVAHRALRRAVNVTARATSDAGLSAPAQRMLAWIAASSADEGTRVDALLHLALQGGERGESAAAEDLLEILEPLRDDRAPRIAAAAWMAWGAWGGSLLEAPREIVDALHRGGPPTALHARVVRAVRRASGS